GIREEVSADDRRRRRTGGGETPDGPRSGDTADRVARVGDGRDEGEPAGLQCDRAEGDRFWDEGPHATGAEGHRGASVKWKTGKTLRCLARRVLCCVTARRC